MLLVFDLVALFGLVMLPKSSMGSRFSIFGGDKLIHVALFGGLSIILRWNFSAFRSAVSNSLQFPSSLLLLPSLPKVSSRTEARSCGTSQPGL
jgi:hypothetical protein